MSRRLIRFSTAAHTSYVVRQDSGAFAGSNSSTQFSAVRSSVGAVFKNPGQIAEGIQLRFLGRLNQAVNHCAGLGTQRGVAWIVSGSAPVWMSTRSSPHWILAAVSATAGLTETSAKNTSFSDTAAWNTFLCQL